MAIAVCQRGAWQTGDVVVSSSLTEMGCTARRHTHKSLSRRGGGYLGKSPRCAPARCGPRLDHPRGLRAVAQLVIITRCAPAPFSRMLVFPAFSRSGKFAITGKRRKKRHLQLRERQGI